MQIPEPTLGESDLSISDTGLKLRERKREKQKEKKKEGGKEGRDEGRKKLTCDKKKSCCLQERLYLGAQTM